MAFWIAAGASAKEVCARAGHTSAVTVLDRYGHLLPGGEEKVTDALEIMLLAGLAEAQQKGQVLDLASGATAPAASPRPTAPRGGT